MHTHFIEQSQNQPSSSFPSIAMILVSCLLLMGCNLPQAASFQPSLSLGSLSAANTPRLAPLFVSSDESINPNDLETPEERKRRMEMVRQIQKSFYQQGDEESTTRTTAISSPNCNTILEELPLWRVQWTELPGYQNMLNVHVAHYTHMFHSILSGPKPWYFGHVFLPGGSENLENPEYRLLKQGDDQNATKVTYTGVLMRVSDAKQLEDGRLALVVQALERFEVLRATQHEPYAIAKVKLIPDAELAMTHYKTAQNMANELSDDFLNDNDAWGAACAAAVETGEQLREFEYRHVQISSSSMGAVAPLANFDMDADTGKVFPAESSSVEEQKDKVVDVMEKHLFSANPMDVPENLNDLDSKKLQELEHDVWLGVDTLVKLLHRLNPDQNEARVTPVPTQMLGLLPRGDWPDGFELEQYANRLEDYAKAMEVGTFSKSPFVRYDFGDNSASQYPGLRRAQRLSFVVWILVENIGMVGDGGRRPLTRQQILEIPTISERLQAAKARLNDINDALNVLAS